MRPLVEALEAFTDPHSEAQLQALDAAVQAINASSCGNTEIDALLGVFERFPEADGFGVFWGILHALEALEGYEPPLFASVQRKPCEFNVLMVNRLLNAGISEIEGQPLADLLISVLSNPQATTQALHDAAQCLARRKVGEA
jgi:hypothetical protein